MRTRSIRPGDLKVGRLTLIFAALTLIFVAVLAVAPLRPYFTEWRRVQQRYNDLAQRAGAATISIGIQQIWKPKLGISDRCVTCHLGMGQAGPVPGDPLFKAHSPIPHDPREFGCSICHGGQGRATSRSDAHGFVSHWDEQLLTGSHATAGCGTCHTNLPAISRSQLSRGRRLVESLDCLSCHKLDGSGRGKGSDLSFAGLRGYRSDWHAYHLDQRSQVTTGEWKSSYGPVVPAELDVIDLFLKSRVGAPRLVEAQALALERGCQGCHKIAGRGGDEGPALDTVGMKPIGDLKFAGVSGQPTFVNYMTQHFLDPAGVVPGSLMPPPVESDEEAALLTSYVLFLRGRDVPLEYLPKERVRRRWQPESASRVSGERLFLAYCSGCHATRGEGRNFGQSELRFPGIGRPDFLAVASDSFIEKTLQSGRSGRRMPGLGAPGGSLGPEEVAAVASHLRSLEPIPPAIELVERAESDPATGRTTYLSDCAACHGQYGEGTTLGSPIAVGDSRITGKRAVAYEAVVTGIADSAMPRYRGYDARTLRSLLDYMDALPRSSGSRASWKLGDGSVAEGRKSYARICAGCHGDQGQGKIGPALANPGFQQAASTEFIAATIVRGRSGTPMPAFGRDSANYPRLTAQEVLDVTAFIRQTFGAQKK